MYLREVRPVLEVEHGRFNGPWSQQVSSAERPERSQRTHGGGGEILEE